VGELADLVVTEVDPLGVDDVRGMKVAATLLGGGFTFKAV
jgi:hypothetical protein